MSDASRLAKWRVLIALAWFDGELAEEEKDWLRKYYKQRITDQAQRDQLEFDISNGVQLDDVLPLVTEKKHKAELCHLANMLFASDGDFSWDEKEIQKKIKADVMKDVDISGAIQAAVNAKNEILEKRAHKKRLDRIERMARSAYYFD